MTTFSETCLFNFAFVWVDAVPRVGAAAANLPSGFPSELLLGFYYS